jgi:hypothetical protein
MVIALDNAAFIELQLFIDNDAELYKKEILPRIMAMKKRIDANTYLPSRCPQLWKYAVDEATRKYCAEFGGYPKDIFPSHLRWALAEHYARYYEEEIKLGNYDNPEDNK